VNRIGKLIRTTIIHPSIILLLLQHSIVINYDNKMESVTFGSGKNSAGQLNNYTVH